MNVYVARQPIFDSGKKIFGYELLFRNGFQNAFPNIDGDIATSNVLSNTFFSFELKELLNNKPGFINFTKDLILQKIPLLFPPKHIVIEVLENIEPDREILEALEEFKKKGFTIALDDFSYDEKFLPMMEFCRIIKIDIMATPLGGLTDIIKEIRENFDITFLAEKVETYEEFEQAKKMGFHMFQGYFFSKPEILSKKEIAAGKIALIRLINEVGGNDFDFIKIEDIIKKDVSVSFKLLKFINSAYFRRPSPIHTIKEAMTYLGMSELRKFIYIIAISDLGQDKPAELIRASVIHARMCELCGTILKTHFSTEELFTLGLFSFMDAILDKPMDSILKTTSFSEKIKTALLRKDKEFTAISNLIISFERGNWAKKSYTVISDTPIGKKLPGFYLDAVRMVNSFFK